MQIRLRVAETQFHQNKVVEGSVFSENKEAKVFLSVSPPANTLPLPNSKPTIIEM